MKFKLGDTVISKSACFQTKGLIGKILQISHTNSHILVDFPKLKEGHNHFQEGRPIYDRPTNPNSCWWLLKSSVKQFNLKIKEKNL